MCEDIEPTILRIHSDYKDFVEICISKASENPNRRKMKVRSRASHLRSMEFILN